MKTIIHIVFTDTHHRPHVWRLQIDVICKEEQAEDGRRSGGVQKNAAQIRVGVPIPSEVLFSLQLFMLHFNNFINLQFFFIMNLHHRLAYIQPSSAFDTEKLRLRCKHRTMPKLFFEQKSIYNLGVFWLGILVVIMVLYPICFILIAYMNWQSFFLL